VNRSAYIIVDGTHRDKEALSPNSTPSPMRSENSIVPSTGSTRRCRSLSSVSVRLNTEPQRAAGSAPSALECMQLA
jgi:hypothetical protein